ncbi:F0F1 ATP synthase subunit B [Streptomyces rhizosphaerihabitans]|uniref:F0F1 ATP synthase subunit B n=1 Tax=Streptomyces rhizosphaerihabitans TaxID=1266770 RepID=UPI0021BE0B7D|nr:F0F1 ATP synthase subunit B [Streptomyces rhizosphaerihabitans]MCT9010704.1 F0F1 ATP synthase subunit B [Streptomyces rhizosphaerihabitans]
MPCAAQSLLPYGLGMGILIPGPAPTVVGVVSFAVVFVCMAKVLLPRINKVLGERKDAIEGQTERAEQLAAEADEVLAKYREELAEARHEAARLRQRALEEGAQLIAEIRAAGLREREAMIVEAQARLAADRVIAETELRGDIVSLATELAGRVVGEALESVANSEIVDRFFSDLDARSVAGLQ